MSHTPGPWKENKYCGVGAGKFGTDPVIIDASGWADGNGDDIQLIVVAPELLAIAKEIDALDDGDEPLAWKHSDLFQRLHDLIAKAELYRKEK